MKDEDTILRQLHARLDKAIWEYRMLQDHDRILVAVSGGADSMSLLHLLTQRYSIYAKHLELCAVYIDLGFGERQAERLHGLETFAHELGVTLRTVSTTIGPYAHSPANSENPCFLCTRIRRKHIFSIAEEMNCNKIVFGHHKDDLVETLLINMIFGREISTSPPALIVKDGRFRILRPLVFAEEALIKSYSRQYQIPCFSQECPTDGHSQRQYVKEMVADLENRFPGSRDNIFWSMKKVKSDYLLS
jgi:tRNA 2-thiocytidine biosynthesis protein TtcA